MQTIGSTSILSRSNDKIPHSIKFHSFHSEIKSVYTPCNTWTTGTSLKNSYTGFYDSAKLHLIVSKHTQENWFWKRREKKNKAKGTSFKHWVLRSNHLCILCMVVCMPWYECTKKRTYGWTIYDVIEFSSYSSWVHSYCWCFWHYFLLFCFHSVIVRDNLFIQLETFNSRFFGGFK